MNSSENDPVVGHKSHYDEATGKRWHTPLLKSEADALIEHCNAEERRRAETMPTEQDAINAMFSAWLRLKELGWREGMYAPKDGRLIDIIESGSTGIHQGSWQSCAFFTGAEGWPSHPTLWRAPLAAGRDGVGGGCDA